MTVGDKKWSKKQHKAPVTETTTRWWQFLRCFVDNGVPKVSAGAVAVWLVLFVQSRDQRVILSIEKIATRTGYSTRSVRRFVDELVEAGILIRTSRGNRIKGPTAYRLLRVNPS